MTSNQSSRSQSALRGAVYGAIFAAGFTLVSAFVSLEGPAITIPPLSPLAASTVFAFISGALAGPAFGFTRSSLQSGWWSYVCAGAAAGFAYVLPTVIYAWSRISASMLLVLIGLGAVAGAGIGIAVGFQQLFIHRRPAA